MGNEFTRQSFYQNKDIKIYKLCSLRCTWPLTKASIFSCRSTSDANSALLNAQPFACRSIECPCTFVHPSYTPPTPSPLHFTLPCLVSWIFFFCAHIYFVFCSLLCADKLYKAIIYKSHIARIAHTHTHTYTEKKHIVGIENVSDINVGKLARVCAASIERTKFNVRKK